MTPGDLRTRVIFRWSSDKVKPSEQVRVAGGAEELGGWKPEHAVPMETMDAISPVHVSRGVLLPLNKEVAYKYLICKRSTGEVLRWEEMEGNRTVRPTGLRQVVEDDGGLYRSRAPQLPQPDAGAAMSRQESPVLSPGESPKPSCSPTSGPDRGPSAQGSVRGRATSSYQAPLAEAQLTEEDVVFVVFRKLPFRVEKIQGKEDWQVVEADSERHYFTVVSLMENIIREDPVKNCFQVKFVGDPGVHTEDPEERRRITEVLAKYRCLPVFLSKDLAEGYKEFCNTFLWPVMHGVKVFGGTVNGAQKLEEAKWSYFQEVNKKYADVIDANYEPRSLIWVHNYYLLLVARYITRRKPEATVGFFLHCAFPSSEVLRCLPQREEIVTSMLSCKVVYFQIFEYARHFLSNCQQLLTTTHSFQSGGVLQVEFDSRSIVVRADHFALPFARLVTALDTEAVQEEAKKIRGQFPQKMLFASLDTNEPFSGMILKLRAFHKFLKDCPQHQQNVALLQHVLEDPERAETGDGSELWKELKRLEEEINQAFSPPGHPPVVKITVGELAVNERLALLQAADVLLDTSINDGWNLQPFMFYCAHSKDRRGLVIVSEFSGCSTFLTAAMKVNPWNTSVIMEQMHEAVCMDDDEREKRFARDYSYISSQTLTEWVHENLKELKRTMSERQGPVRGLGAGRRLLYMEQGFRHLNTDAVLHDYRQAKLRAIFLDNEGTLAPDVGRAVFAPKGVSPAFLRKEGSSLDPKVRDCLRMLAKDPKNVVVVISGRSKSFMDKTFEDVEGIGLCAEYGFEWLAPGKLQQGGGAAPPDVQMVGGGGAEAPAAAAAARAGGGGGGSGGKSWQRMLQKGSDDDDAEWKDIVFQLMQMYVKRVQGSTIEYKGSAITWKYHEVGALTLAEEMARELARFLDPEHPDGLLYGHDVAIAAGKGYVEVKRKDIHKGVAVTRVLQDLNLQFGTIDFVLCIGDDRSDEDMFQAMADWKEVGRGLPKTGSSRSIVSQFSASLVDPMSPTKERKPSVAWQDPAMNKKASLTIEDMTVLDRETKYFTVTVGRKPSKAGYFVKNTTEVSELLQRLAEASTKLQLGRFASMPLLAHQMPCDDELDSP